MPLRTGVAARSTGRKDFDTLRIARIEQALEDDPAREDGVEGEVDPAEAAEGHRPLDLVLAQDDVAGVERGDERILLAALGAEALVARELCAALRAEALALGHDAGDQR